MALRIRSKFVAILLVAAGIPLALALIANMVVGQRRLLAAQRVLFLESAQHLATSIDLALVAEIEKVREWAMLSRLHQLVPAPGPAPGPGEVARRDAAWPGLDMTSPLLRGVVENRVADELRRFQAFNPIHVELLVTDARGGIVAATGKTTDYWQADEPWWTSAVAQAENEVTVDGIQYDDSANVQAFEICLAVRDPSRPGEPPLGVLKSVLRAGALLEPFRRLRHQGTPRVFLMDAAGAVAFEFAGREEGSAIHPGVEAAATIGTSPEGHGVVKFRDGKSYVFGSGLVTVRRLEHSGLVVRGARRLHVVVARDRALVLAPIRAQMGMLLGAGVLVLTGCLWAGWYIASRKIIDPIERLRAGAERISAAIAGQQEPGGETALPEGRGPPSFADIDRIQTGDEIEDLARSFGTMARRVAGYQEQLERDIAAKTEEIRRDLMFARDFQRSLLPCKYPVVTDSLSGSLHFHHIYQPANAVSGDFFDIRRISDASAAVFIADVMGHGARSALATAILATLMQEFRDEAADPARFLQRLNRQFHEVVRTSEDLLFVTAFHAVFDTHEGRIRWASAGHHAPIIGNRSTRDAGPLYENLPACPALGLLPEAVYTNHVAALPQDSVILLFTDGVLEAPDIHGGEFGRARLTASLRKRLHLHARGIVEGVVADMRLFTARDQTPDDVCVLAVEMQSHTNPVQSFTGIA